jgi:MscS family membrane protein
MAVLTFSPFGGNRMDIFSFTSAQWWDLGISLGIIVLTILLARPVLSFVLDKIIKRITGATKTTLDDVLIEAVRGPLYWLIVLWAIQFSIERLNFFENLVSLNLDEIYYVFTFLIWFVVIWRLTSKLVAWYTLEIAPKTNTDLDNQLLPFLRRILLILLTILGGIILLGHFQIEVSGLVTTLGIGSLAIALAAQAALSDTISGFMIMFDRPFRIGDRIEVQDLETWGDVVDIGLRSTHIRTLDNRTVIVPNSVIAKSLIVNHSYPDSHYRIQIEIGVDYGVDLEKVRQVLIEAVRPVEGVLTDKPIEALFLQFADSALIFRVRWWIESYVDTRRMFDKVNTAIYNNLEEAGISIPFPQREVYHKIRPEDIEGFKQIFGDK